MVNYYEMKRRAFEMTVSKINNSVSRAEIILALKLKFGFGEAFYDDVVATLESVKKKE